LGCLGRPESEAHELARDEHTENERATSVDALEALDSPMSNVGSRTRTRKKSPIQAGLESWRTFRKTQDDLPK
jgi:hypothetical protein